MKSLELIVINDSTINDIARAVEFFRLPLVLFVCLYVLHYSLFTIHFSLWRSQLFLQELEFLEAVDEG